MNTIVGVAMYGSPLMGMECGLVRLRKLGGGEELHTDRKLLLTVLPY